MKRCVWCGRAAPVYPGGLTPGERAIRWWIDDDPYNGPLCAYFDDDVIISDGCARAARTEYRMGGLGPLRERRR